MQALILANCIVKCAFTVMLIFKKLVDVGFVT